MTEGINITKNTSIDVMEKLRAVVDTVQVTTDLTNIDYDKVYGEEETENKELEKCLKRVQPSAKMKPNIMIKAHNINKENNGTEHYITSLKEQKEVIKAVLENVGVNTTLADLNRVDVAIDLDIDFVKNFKLLDFLHSLLIASEYGSALISINKKTYKKNSIKLLRQTSFELVFYDKEDESKGKAEYKTRLEFRYKRKIIGNLDIPVGETIARLNGGQVKKNKQIITICPCIDNMKIVEKQTLEILKNKWNEYIEERKKPNFSEFARCNADLIYTRDMLQELYRYVGLKGSFNEWLKKLKKGYTEQGQKSIEFISKGEMKKFIADCTRALKKYSKS